MPQVISALDKFRGTATSGEASDAVARAADRAGLTTECIGVSDGGEGFLDALGGANRSSPVDRVGAQRVATPWRLDGDTAFIEMSQVDGLTAVGGAERNDALAATSRATGSLIGAVLGHGVGRVVVGLGGSASTDGGLGCVEVLTADPRLRGIELVGACDVMVPFASALEFAEQKGATPAERRLLAGRLERVAQIYEADFDIDIRQLPGSGAAGGLGGGLAALGGSLTPGFDLVAEELALRHRIAGAETVVTGEGWLDRHSFEGKAVGGILSICASLEVPAVVVVGGADPGGADRAEAQGAVVLSLVELYGPERARSHTLECIESAVTIALAP